MSFNLFGPATKSDIRVGYIDPERGFVGNLTVYEANKYAKLNPGTTFIFRRRDKIQYMNINGVNALTAKDLLPSNSASGGNGCDGITGLDIYEDGTDGTGTGTGGTGTGTGGTGTGTGGTGGGFSDIKPEVLAEISPRVRFSGGGGIGAKGNGIYGTDGSLLAVDLIEGGWGYQYAPITDVFDDYGIASGAVVRSIMIGDPDYPECKFFKTVETFENEEDFEEYDLSGAPSESFGRRYDKDGKNIGIWDPTLYATLEDDPIRLEIQRYQDFLLSLRKESKVNVDDNIVRNWWTTRKERPLQVTAANRKSRVMHEVDYPAWTEFMNLHAISPVPPSNAPGSDFAGIEHTIEWEEDFPYDGDYIFKYLADNVADIFLDNELVGRTKRFKGSPDKLKRFVKSGVHRIRVDLENIPIYEKVVEPVGGNNKIPVVFEVYGEGNDSIKQIKFSFASEDGSDSFILNNAEKGGSSYKKEINVLRNTNYKVVAVADNAPEKSDKREFEINFDGLNRANDPIEVSGNNSSNQNNTLKLRDGSGSDANAKFTIVSTSPGLKAKFTDDGKKLIVTGQSKGDVTLKLEWDDNPSTAGVAVKSIKIGDTKWIQSGKKGNVKRTININKISNNTLTLEQGTLKKGTFGDKGSESSDESDVIFADITTSSNDNDDMQVRCGIGKFIPSNKRSIDGHSTYDLTFRVDVKPEPKKSSPGSEGVETAEIFNTKEFIDKADRKLWRINPNAGRDGDFLNKFGVLPFDPQTSNSSTTDFAGTHVIRWEYVNFPISGNYSIETMVDDDVVLYIGNRAGGGRMEIGNGLDDINNGGDEVIIKKKGFSGPGKSTGKSIETRYFEAGKYRIRAELKQIPGKPLSGGNPMALAVKITTTIKEKKVISPRSWNENPMGVSMVIDAPLPPIPQEPKPVGEGRCPNNPLWTTRFPGSKDKWFPVTLDDRWSPFMNRYALSPIPPLATPGSDNSGGAPYRTSWVIEAPYAGFYGLKGTVDNGGRILVNGNEVMSGGLNYPDRGLEGFKSKSPQTVKFPLSAGKHTIEVEVVNQVTETFKKVNKKVFNTKDWGTPAKTIEKQGESKITYIGLNAANRDVKVTETLAGKKEFNIDYTFGSSRVGRRVVSTTKVQFDDNIDNGFDLNSSFRIVSTSPGIKARFNSDASKLIVTGKSFGNVTLKFEHDDNPKTSGTAVKQIKVGDKTWKARGEKGQQSLTIDVGRVSGRTETNNSGGKIKVTNNGKKIKLRDGHGDDTNSSFTIVAGDATFSSDGRSISGKGECAIELNWDDNPNIAGVAVEQIKIEGVTWTQSGKRGKDKKTVRIGTSKSIGLESGSVKNGVTYSGPPISSYIKGMISPTLQDVGARPNEEIQGKQWVMRWDNVDFPISGQYKIRTQVDDEVDVLIDGVKVQTATIRPPERRSDPIRYQAFTATAGKKSIELRLRNIRIPNTGFQENPTAVRMDIVVPVDVSTGLSRPWIDNPVGISAILVPPPCPLEVIGKGKICKVVVDDPGNGFPVPPTISTGEGTYPVTLELEGIEVINPGINHNCGVDEVVIEPSNGVQLSYECDTFGRIIAVNVDTPGRFTRTPVIRVITDTGTNFQAVPRFNVIRDPVIDVEPEEIIQVTDLVGLKQTGYINGRAYYGSVFFKDGVRYAGIYETPGQLIQVYDTLQESIDAEVTTPPSAIQRSGTDVRSNNPRLNIPGTPDSLT